MSRIKLTAVVTGASSGIGVEFARGIALRGKYNIVLVARRADRLESLKAELEQSLTRFQAPHRPAVSIVVSDLSNEAGRDFLAKELEFQGAEVHLLVNNAGFGSYGEFVRHDVRRELEMVRLNCQAPLELCHRFLPGMLKRRSGEIINVCSTAAFLPIPFMATYAATKSFLLEYSLALASEVRSHGVNVLAHCPGPTESEFHIAAGLSEKLKHLPAMTAREVADEALVASERGRNLLVNGVSNKLLVFASRLIPPQWLARIVGWRIGHEIRENAE
jgi:short-subunit dehydrogenase